MQAQNKTEWDFSQRKQKEKGEGNIELLLLSKEQLQPAVFNHTSSNASALSERWHTLSPCLRRLPDGTDFLLSSFHSPS